MKPYLRFLAFILIAAVMSGIPVVTLAEEEADKPGASADLGVFSQYIWRGFELSDDSIVIQPSVTLDYKGFSFNIWGNLDTKLKRDSDDGSENDDVKYNETDLTLSYGRDLGAISLNGGMIYYALDSEQDSQEVFVSVTVNTLLSPTFSVYREISHLPAWYASLEISHSQEIYNQITLDLSASAGYYYSDDDDFSEIENPDSRYRTLHDGLITAGLTIPIGESASVHPIIAYSFPISGTADDYITAGSISDASDFLYGGVTLSVAF